MAVAMDDEAADDFASSDGLIIGGYVRSAMKEAFE